MNTVKKILRDAIGILISVSETRKQVIRTIATKGAPKYRYALSGTISTTQFGRSTGIARRGDMSSRTVLHFSQQVL